MREGGGKGGQQRTGRERRDLWDRRSPRSRRNPCGGRQACRIHDVAGGSPRAHAVAETSGRRRRWGRRNSSVVPGTIKSPQPVASLQQDRSPQHMGAKEPTDWQDPMRSPEAMKSPEPTRPLQPRDPHQVLEHRGARRGGKATMATNTCGIHPPSFSNAICRALPQAVGLLMLPLKALRPGCEIIKELRDQREGQVRNVASRPCRGMRPAAQPCLRSNLLVVPMPPSPAMSFNMTGQSGASTKWQRRRCGGVARCEDCLR